MPPIPSLLVGSALALALTVPPAAASAQSDADETFLREAIEERVAIVRRWAREPALIASVLEANAVGVTPEEIERRDVVWQATTGVDSFMQRLLEAPSSRRLRELSLRTPELGEAFVTDRRGANVAMTRRTSDYWQGDEDKFRRAFTGRLDAYHVDPVQFDESIQAYAVQIAVPVAASGRAVGVLVVTVNLELLVGGL